MDLFALSARLEQLSTFPWILAPGTPELNRRTEFDSLGSLQLSYLDISQLKSTGKQIVEAISHTKVLRNLTSPLNNLPSEILANIFSFLQTPVRRQIPFPLPSNPLRDCIYASHVCRHWRRTALSTPSLWSHAHFGNDSAEIPLQWFRQSKAIPSRVYYTAPLPEDSQDNFAHDALHEVLQCGSQIQEFHVGTPWVRNSPFWELLKRPAPLLESISFEMDCANSEDVVTILPPIFNDELPNLKNLYLSNVSAWPYNCFRNLVRFTLYDQPQDSRPSLFGFLTFLAESSATLEELVIVRAGPTHYEMGAGIEIPKSAPTITLSALCYLEIGDSDPWVADGNHLRSLLAHIAIPPTTKRCFWESSQYLTLSDYFPQFNNQGHGGSGIKKVVLTSYETSSAHACMVGFDASTLYLNFRWDAPQRVLHSHQRLLENVEELVYAPGETWNTQFDREILECLPSLRTLKVSGALWSKPHRHLPYLGELSIDDNDLDVSTTFEYAPYLENLHIYSCRDQTRVQPKAQIEVLATIGTVRQTKGCSVKALVVDRFPEDEVVQLQDHFENVIPIDSREDEIGLSRDDILSQFWDWYSVYQALW